jgi:hypothetical protein
MLALGGSALANFLLAAVTFLPDFALDLPKSLTEGLQIFLALLAQGLLHGGGKHNQARHPACAPIGHH